MDCQVKRVSLVSLETLVYQDRTDDLGCQDLKVPKETQVSLEDQAHQEPQELKATWERWASQDPQGRKELRVNQVGRVDPVVQEHQGSLELKESPVPLALVPQELQVPRVSPVSQDSPDKTE